MHLLHTCMKRLFTTASVTYKIKEYGHNPGRVKIVNSIDKIWPSGIIDSLFKRGSYIK